MVGRGESVGCPSAFFHVVGGENVRLPRGVRKSGYVVPSVVVADAAGPCAVAVGVLPVGEIHGVRFLQPVVAVAYDAPVRQVLRSQDGHARRHVVGGGAHIIGIARTCHRHVRQVGIEQRVGGFGRQCRLADAVDGPVGVVAEGFYADGACVVAAERPVVVEEVPLPLEFRYARVYAGAVPRLAAEDALVFVGALYAVSHGVVYPFGHVGRIRQVVFSVVLVYPGCFLEGESVEVYRHDFPFGLCHVPLQPHGVAFPVAPEEPGLPVVVYEDRGVDAYPVVVCPRAVGRSQQRLAQRVLIGPLRPVGHGHSDARPVRADVEIVFAVPLDGLCGIGPSAPVPSEVGQPEWGGMLRPVPHVRGGKQAPVLQVPGGIGVVVRGKQPQRVPYDHRGRVGRVAVADNRVADGRFRLRGFL